jgi:hypothetical protein
MFKWHCKGYKAHRAAWQVASGKSIPDGLLVLHTCDRPRCMFPAHLFLGTDADNGADKAKKERGPQKLSAAQVREIRKLHQAGSITQAELARKFGVDQSQICRILSRLQRRHVL